MEDRYDRETSRANGGLLPLAGAFLITVSLLALAFSPPRFREEFAGASWYLPLSLLAAVLSAGVLAGLLSGRSGAWRLAVTAAVLDMAVVFALFGVVQLGAVTADGTANPEEPRQYYLGLIFMLIIFVSGYLASPKVQKAHGLAVDVETTPS